ncbi:hypothetical protein [Rhodopirellula sp. MGV]|uniref:hypothetical protein n=1 Tax=Rhodopirellula sp. MGV TaxID=2023130 RepID=UPI000B965CB5|nr:hypothetical protein [Rhodopirellula sp. MGV]
MPKTEEFRKLKTATSDRLRLAIVVRMARVRYDAMLVELRSRAFISGSDRHAGASAGVILRETRPSDGFGMTVAFRK